MKSFLDNLPPDERVHFISHDDANTNYAGSNISNLLKKQSFLKSEVFDIAIELLFCIRILRKNGMNDFCLNPDCIYLNQGIIRIDISNVDVQNAPPLLLPPEELTHKSTDEKHLDTFSLGKILYLIDTGEELNSFPNTKESNYDKLASPWFTSVWSKLASNIPAERVSDLNDISKMLNQALQLGKEHRIQLQQKQHVYISLMFILILALTFLAYHGYNHFSKHKYIDIFDAISDNNVSAVSEFISNDSEIDKLSAHGISPIMAAIKQPGINSKIILMLAANKNSMRPINGISPLEFAILEHSSPEIIDIVLLNTPSPSSLTAQNGGNLLHTAIACKDIDAFIRLIPRISPGSIDNDGHSTLMNAMHSQQFDMAEILLRNGEKIDFTDKNGMTILHMLLPGSEKIAENAIGSLNVNAQNSHGYTPLISAIRNKSTIHCIKLLLDNKADPNLYDNEGITPVMEAIALNYHEAFELLQSHNANLNATDIRGFTPLHYAVLYNRSAIMKILLESNVNVNAKDSSGRTPLHLSALRGLSELSLLLMNNGADKNIKDNLSFTPAELALIGGHDGTADIIDPDAKLSKEGSIYFKLMQIFNLQREELAPAKKEELANILRKCHNGNTSKALVDELFIILNGEPGLSSISKENNDPMLLAVMTNNMQIASKIASCEPNVNIANEDGITPIAQAIINNNVQMMELLFFKGAYINVNFSASNDLLDIVKNKKASDASYFLGTCLYETMLENKNRDGIFDHIFNLNIKSKFTPYSTLKKQKNILSLNDFLLYHANNKNASALKRTLSLSNASPNLQNSAGNFFLSSTKTSYHCMKTMLEEGASVNIHGNDGKSPLLLAITNADSFPVIRLLLDYGADPMSISKGSQNISAMQVAQQNNMHLVEKIMLFYIGRN